MAALAKADKVLEAAVDLAREAAVEIADLGAVGDHLGLTMVQERLGVHYFTCTSRAYPGWRWAVSVARVPRAKAATVCETSLMPGDGAMLSPDWVPYAARLAPGDIGPGDITPHIADDPNLESGFEATGDEDVDQMALWELGLGRSRVLSAHGLEVAAQRWHDGENGPAASIADKAPAACSTCGYFLPMPGLLRQAFGVCANAWSPSDGRVVALQHGCGAHSEVDIAPAAADVVPPPLVDDFVLDLRS